MKLRLIKEVSPRLAVAAAVLVLAVSVVSGRQFADSPVPQAELAPRAAPDGERIRREDSNGDLDNRDFDLQGLHRDAGNERQVIADIFAPPGVDAPPEVKEALVRAAPTARPQAPELPFRYVGRMLEGSRPVAFLLKGEEPHSASPGERIGADYRLVAMNESQLTFVYLPLGTRQTLSLAETPAQPPARPPQTE